MITVEDVIQKSNKEAVVAQEQKEEILKTGQVKSVKKSYLGPVLLLAGAIAGAIWLLKKGKEDNGTIPG